MLNHIAIPHLKFRVLKNINKIIAVRKKIKEKCEDNSLAIK
jgi:hypothetical protein